MYVNEKYPYAALFAGLVFLTLPFALSVHDALAFVFGRTGLLVSVSDGGFGWRGGWDGVVWFVYGVFAFLNVVVSAGRAEGGGGGVCDSDEARGGQRKAREEPFAYQSKPNATRARGIVKTATYYGRLVQARDDVLTRAVLGG